MTHAQGLRHTPHGGGHMCVETHAAAHAKTQPCTCGHTRVGTHSDTRSPHHRWPNCAPPGTICTRVHGGWRVRGAPTAPGDLAAAPRGRASPARRGCVTRVLTHRYLCVPPLYIAPCTPHLLVRHGGWQQGGTQTTPCPPRATRGQVAPCQPPKSQRWPGDAQQWWHRATWQGQRGRHEGSSRSL